jgi:hypothetical protein
MMHLNGTLVSCLVAGALLAAGLIPAGEAGLGTASSGGALRGKTRTQVIEELGVPGFVSAAPGVTVFGYGEAPDEGLAVVFHEDVAVLVQHPSAQPGGRGPAPSSGWRPWFHRRGCTC